METVNYSNGLIIRIQSEILLGDAVLDGTPCEWECNSGLSYGNKLRNQVKCSGGNWDGVKKVKCNGEQIILNSKFQVHLSTL